VVSLLKLVLVLDRAADRGAVSQVRQDGDGAIVIVPAVANR